MEAKLSLKDLYFYIAYKLFNNTAASKTVNGIISTINKLTTFPYKHSFCEEKNLQAKGCRCTNYKNYRIIYNIIEKEKLVLILNIIYSKRIHYKL